MLQAWVDGGLVPAAEARVSVFDRGFRTGEGVFETFRTYRGHVFRLGAHLDRAYAGAGELGFEPPDRAAVGGAVRATAEVNLAAIGGGDGVVRLTLTPGPLDPDSPFPGRTVGPPTVVVTAHPLAVDPTVHARGVSATPVPWSRELPHVKAVSHLSASLARARARDAGTDEALLTDGDGCVLEGAASNVFAVIDGTAVTPPVAAGILAGVTRMVTLELAARLELPVEERALALAELLAADEAFLTATTREIVPLVRVGEHQVGDGSPGPWSRRLHSAYREEVERERAAG